MASGSAYAAEGKGYVTAATRKEDAGDKEAAKQLYLRASKAFLNAARESGNPSDKNFRKNLAEKYYLKAMSLSPRKKKKVAPAGGGGGGDDEEDAAPEVIPMEKPDMTFKDVGGMADVKEEIRKAIVYPFEHPEIYEMYGKKAGEGILFYGPPGCGKTFIAKAAAGECNAAFLTLKVSDILDKYVGGSEQKLNSAFDAARKYAPSILFLDEIDAIAGRRSEATEHSKRLVNELLVQLDGVGGKVEKMLTLAATNEPWAVDPALRRPGRFSRLVLVPNPDHAARAAIFKIQMRKRMEMTDTSVNFTTLAKMTEGFSSADLAQICTEAADKPLEEALSGKPPRKIQMRDFEGVLSKRTSSLIAWFQMARQQIIESGEQDVFKDLWTLIKKYERSGLIK